jgi:hypothetical protein
MARRQQRLKPSIADSMVVQIRYHVLRIPAGNRLCRTRVLVRRRVDWLMAADSGAVMEQIDWHLRQWPVAGMLLSLATMILPGATLASH